ncbi:MAG: hypothetical protein BAJATHORv1_30107 [Candidatus Thorarchaeota archaeon]|nr:MAG: hypothetical protein BAJATHORv1_30107 [Candidatus Thorarchaeota archaeon]
MTEERESTESNPSSEDEKPQDVRKDFNPMVTWILLCGALAVSYGLLWLGGYPLLTMFMVFLLVWHGYNTKDILENLNSSFPRKATYFNAIHAIFWFGFLAINAYWFSQYSLPLLIPQLPTMTELSPLWILMSVFGTLNVREMYEPNNESEKIRYTDFI